MLLRLTVVGADEARCPYHQNTL